MTGRLVGIYLAPAGAAPMRALPAAVAEPGLGLVGDRYALGTGEWSGDPRLCSEVTLVAVEDLAAAEAEASVHLQGGRSRRNLETEGVDLLALVGRRFTVGAVTLYGERPCAPCRYLDRVTGEPAKAALSGRGGLRATVVTGGRLRIGDPVNSAVAHEPPGGG